MIDKICFYFKVFCTCSIYMLGVLIFVGTNFPENFTIFAKLNRPKTKNLHIKHLKEN